MAKDTSYLAPTLIESLRFEPPKLTPPAESILKSLLKQLKHFQSRLDGEMEIGIIANGVNSVLHVLSVDHDDWQLIIFDGIDSEGRKARLIQHFTQINLQIVAVAKLKEKATRIGF
jgi:hypothetical protein